VKKLLKHNHQNIEPPTKAPQVETYCVLPRFVYPFIQDLSVIGRKIGGLVPGNARYKRASREEEGPFIFERSGF
jgi:hypothetical protein